jgi:hypothetical protein
MIEQIKVVDFFMVVTASLSMLGVFAAIVVTAYIFNKTKKDSAEVDQIKQHLSVLKAKFDESGYISDQIANVLYDLFDLSAATKAYVELIDSGYKIDDKLFRDMNRRVMLLEKHFAELGLFSQDEDRRKSVQRSLASMYGDDYTLKIMEKIANGSIGIKDENIRGSIKLLASRLKANILYVDSTTWTGRPSRGAF